MGCLGFAVRGLMDFHAPEVHEAPGSLFLLITSGATLNAENRVQLNFLFFSITISTQTLHLFPF